MVRAMLEWWFLVWSLDEDAQHIGEAHVAYMNSDRYVSGSSFSPLAKTLITLRG